MAVQRFVHSLPTSVKSTLLEGLENYPCHSKPHKNVWGARRLFFELLVSFKRNLALPMNKCAAHSDVCITLQCMHASSTCLQTPPVHVTTVTKRHLPYETSILQACSTLLWEVDRDFLMEVIKWNVVNATWGVPMAQKSVMPLVIQNFSHGIFHQCCEDEQNCEWVELQGHIDCPSTFMKFLNVAKSFPTTGDQLTSLGSANPSFVHVIYEEGKTEDTWPLPA